MDNTKTALLGLVGATEEETQPSPTPTEERLKELENQNQMLMECLLEMSETVYA